MTQAPVTFSPILISIDENTVVSTGMNTGTYTGVKTRAINPHIRGEFF
jgi:hypothetical protein